jgi:hypothetical protein
MGLPKKLKPYHLRGNNENVIWLNSEFSLQ